jgi:hypothetical protein
MRKQIVPIILSASLLFAFSVLAEEPAETKPITFRGIEWLSSRTDPEAALADEQIEDRAYMSDRHSIDWPEGSYEWYGSSHKDTLRIEDGGWCGMYSGVTVGGYAPSYSYAYYIYPVLPDGSLNKSDESAQLYLGLYDYEGGDFENIDAVFDDLSTKLSSLYGECSENNDDDYKRKMWTDSDGNKVILINRISNKYPRVKLLYESGRADELLTDVEEAINKENAAAQESERLANASNTDGL